MSACDIIEQWDEAAFSGEGGRLDLIGDLVNETMETYGFETVPVAEWPGLMDTEYVPAKWDPDTKTIYFDPDYLASGELSSDEAVNLAIHESIHAMDELEDGELQVTEGQVAATAFSMYKNAVGDCQSEPPESGAGSDTGGW